MKKIISTLLAVSLLVSLAVPAFASSTSGMSGDSSKVTMAAFDKSSYTIPKNSEIDFANEVSAFVDKTQLVLDANLTFELTNDTTGTFAISGSTVYAAESTGTATLIVKNIDDKQVGTVKLVAGTQKPVREASGFRFVDKINNIPATSKATSTAIGVDAKPTTIKIAPTPTGSVFSKKNKTEIEEKVIAAIVESTKLSNKVKDAVIGEPAVAHEFTMAFSGTAAGDAPAYFTYDGVKVLIETGMTPYDIPAAYADAHDKAEKEDSTKQKYKVTVAPSPSHYFLIFAAKKGGKEHALPMFNSSVGINGIGVVSMPSEDAKDEVITVPASPAEISAATELDEEGNIVINIIGGAFTADELAKFDKSKKEVAVTADMTLENGTVRRTTAKAVVQPVAGEVAINVTAPSSIKIEVGQDYKLHEKVNYVASDSNIKGTVHYDEDYLNHSADNYDYAIVSDTGVVTGVAVGKNKITSKISYKNLENKDITKYATTIVEVVAKGTLPTTPEESIAPSINPTANMFATRTHKIIVKNAGDAAVTFSTYNPKVATVAADGTVKAMAEGTTKIAVMIDGLETLYVTVNVKELTPPGDVTKPTTPPATGV